MFNYLFFVSGMHILQYFLSYWVTAGLPYMVDLRMLAVLGELTMRLSTMFTVEL